MLRPYRLGATCVDTDPRSLSAPALADGAGLPDAPPHPATYGRSIRKACAVEAGWFGRRRPRCRGPSADASPLPNRRCVLRHRPPILQALLAGLFTWSVTALGAALVFFMRTMNRALLDAMMGFAAGVMIAASFFSLLVPSIDMAEAQGLPAWLPATVGFVLGGAFLRVADGLLPHLHIGAKMSEAEGLSTSWQRATLLVLAITLHNIPEGLAVGVAFGAAAAGLDAEGATLAGALTLAVGIGLQNFPEGTSVSMPLRGEGLSRLKSFWYGQLSGAVEPISAVAGAAAVLAVRPLLPYALAFAAGAMIYVVVEELIPESQQHDHTDLATMGALFGFTVMMFLDVALG